MNGSSTAFSCLGVIISCLLVHAAMDPLYARFLHAFGSEGIVVSGLLVHAARNPEDTADVLVSAFTPVSSLLVMHPSTTGTAARPPEHMWN